MKRALTWLLCWLADKAESFMHACDKRINKRTDAKEVITYNFAHKNNSNNADLDLTSDEINLIIAAGYKQYPEGYEFRVTHNDFTRGELQARIIRNRKSGRKYIQPDWFHVAWCDNILREVAAEQMT